MCDIAAATALFSSYYPNTLYTDAEHFEKKHINMEITAKLVHHFQLECTPAVKRHESVFV